MQGSPAQVAEGSPRSRLYRDGRGRLRAVPGFWPLLAAAIPEDQLKLGSMSGFQEMAGRRWDMASASSALGWREVILHLHIENMA